MFNAFFVNIVESGDSVLKMVTMRTLHCYKISEVESVMIVICKGRMYTFPPPSFSLVTGVAG